jgi:histidine triad (HIT) family protein
VARQVDGCKFCEIAAEKPPWALDHGNGVVSFKPFGAAHPEHRMFVPAHHVSGADEDPELTGDLFAEAARWAAGKEHDFNLIVNSGPIAGQSVFHIHVHSLPRRPGDGLALFEPRKAGEGESG